MFCIVFPFVLRLMPPTNVLHQLQARRAAEAAVQRASDALSDGARHLELECVDVETDARRISNLEAELSNLRAALRELSASAMRNLEELAELSEDDDEARVVELEAELVGAEQAAAAARGDLVDAEERIAALQNEVVDMKAEAKEAELVRAEQEAAAARAGLVAAEERIAALQNEVADMHKAEAKARRDLADAIEEHSKELAVVRQAHCDEVVALRLELAAHRDAAENAQTEVADLQGTNAKLVLGTEERTSTPVTSFCMLL